MKKIGGALAFFGIGSMILSFLDREFILLSWVDNWGSGVGWAIRIAMAVIGGIMYLVDKED